jgi:Flp pilus assembly protein TadG
VIKRPPIRHAQRGSYAIIVALMLVILLGFAALAIDVSYLRLTRLQAQNAADAGAHAALIELRRTRDEIVARDRAVSIVGLNVVAGDSALLDPARDVVFGGWDFDGKFFDPSADFVNAVKVTVRRDGDSPGGAVPLMIGRVLGTDAAETKSTGSSIGALRAREVMIVQDVTHSFADEMSEARQADILLLDFMHENGFPGDALGMVSFVGAAEVWTPLGQIGSTYGSTRAQWLNLDWCNRNYWPFTVLYTELFHDAPQMINCSAGSPTVTYYQDSGTNQGSGLELAIDRLIDTGTTDAHALKTIVIISDGKPQCVPEGTACDGEVAAFGVEMADRAEAENISIFSVSMNETADPEQSAYLESLIRGYGTFYETPDATELPIILEKIAAAIPISIVQ